MIASSESPSLAVKRNLRNDCNAIELSESFAILKITAVVERKDLLDSTIEVDL